jgi:hypothetical protein
MVEASRLRLRVDPWRTERSSVYEPREFDLAGDDQHLANTGSRDQRRPLGDLHASNDEPLIGRACDKTLMRLRRRPQRKAHLRWRRPFLRPIGKLFRLG